MFKVNKSSQLCKTRRRLFPPHMESCFHFVCFLHFLNENGSIKKYSIVCVSLNNLLNFYKSQNLLLMTDEASSIIVYICQNDFGLQIKRIIIHGVAKKINSFGVHAYEL